MSLRGFTMGASLVLCGALGITQSARGADAPTTAEVLAKVHRSNQKEIAIGKLAEANGKSKGVKAFGRSLVRDHTAADKKVAALAMKANVNLPMQADDKDMAEIGHGDDFDATFAQMMLEDHKRDLAEVTAARDSTTDEDLKKLLTAMVPTLQKHEQTAQSLVDRAGQGK